MRPRLPFLPVIAGWLAFFSVTPSPAPADDFQMWNWATVDLSEDESERWRFYLYLDNRIGDDVSEPYLQIISPRLKWRAHEHLDLGLGYAWLNIDPLSGADSYWQHRAEFEFNPKFRAGPWSWHNRNRLELRWNDGRGKRRPRLRNRLQVKYGLGEGEGAAFFKHLYANNEFFFDLSSGDYIENRLIPFAVGIGLSERATLNLFFMRQSLNRANGWEHANVVGTFLRLGF